MKPYEMASDPVISRNTQRRPSVDKTSWQRRGMHSLDEVSVNDTQIHVVYDDTDECDVTDDSTIPRIWVSCCGLVRAAEWPVPGSKSPTSRSKPLNRFWKSLDCVEDPYATITTPREIPIYSDDSADNLDDVTAIYDVPRKIPIVAEKPPTKDSLFRYKSNPSLLDGSRKPMFAYRDSDNYCFPLDDGSSSAKELPVITKKSRDDSHLSHFGRRNPFSSSKSLDRINLKRFSANDITSLNSLSDGEEVTTSEENIYMELPVHHPNALAEVKHKAAQLKKNLKQHKDGFIAALSGGSTRTTSPREGAIKSPRQPHKELNGIKRKLTNLLKKRTPSYAKIQNCPKVERAVLNRDKIPLPEIPTSKVEISYVEDVYAVITDAKAPLIPPSSPIVVNPEASNSSPSDAIYKVSDDSGKQNRHISMLPPEPNFATHPHNKKKKLQNLAMEPHHDTYGHKTYSSGGFGSNSLLSPVLCCVNSGFSDSRKQMKIEHWYQEKCDKYDYAIPRAARLSSNAAEEFHSASLSEFKPREEKDERPEEEKQEELDELLYTFISFMKANMSSDNLSDANRDCDYSMSSEIAPVVTKGDPKYIDPISYYKLRDMPLNFNSAQYQQNQSKKPIYSRVTKKSTCSNTTQAQSVDSDSNNAVQSFLSADVDDYASISERDVYKRPKSESILIYVQ